MEPCLLAIQDQGLPQWQTDAFLKSAATVAALRTNQLANAITVDNYLALNMRHQYLINTMIPTLKEVGETEIAEYLDRRMGQGCATPEGLDELPAAGPEVFGPVQKIKKQTLEMQTMIYVDRMRRFESGQLLGPWDSLEEIPLDDIAFMPETYVDRRTPKKPQKLPRCTIDFSRDIEGKGSPNGCYTREQTRITQITIEDVATIAAAFEGAAGSDLQDYFGKPPGSKAYLRFQVIAVYNPFTGKTVYMVDCTLVFGKSDGCQLGQAFHWVLIKIADIRSGGRLLESKPTPPEHYGLKKGPTPPPRAAIRMDMKTGKQTVIKHEAQWADTARVTWSDWRSSGSIRFPIGLIIDDVIMPTNAATDPKTGEWQTARQRGHLKMQMLGNEYTRAGLPFDPIEIGGGKVISFQGQGATAHVIRAEAGKTGKKTKTKMMTNIGLPKIK